MSFTPFVPSSMATKIDEKTLSPFAPTFVPASMATKLDEKQLSPWAKVFVPQRRSKADHSSFQGSSTEDEGSSTDAGDDIVPTFVNFDDFSSDSEVSEHCSTPRVAAGATTTAAAATLTTCVYSMMMLLRRRPIGDDKEDLSGLRYSTQAMSDLPSAAPTNANVSSHNHSSDEMSWSRSDQTSWRSNESSWRQALPVSSAESWVSKQRNRNPEEDENVTRAYRSILNKLTVEKFDSLFAQLTTCGITQPHHISILMREVFEKATTQHHFVPMYAELCVQLEKNPQIVSAVEEGIDTFRRLLLNECQSVFEQVLESRSDQDKAEENKEAAFRRKQRALGNMKLIGQLLAHGMLSSDLFAECAAELLRNHKQCPEALEALVALVMVAGPKFDKSTWQYYGRLQRIFSDMSLLTKDKTVSPRLRFLIRDVLDARLSGWPSSPGASNIAGIGPSKLEEVKKQAVAPTVQQQAVAACVKEEAKVIAESLQFTKTAPWKAQKRATFTLEETPPLKKQGFQVVEFRRALNSIFSDLASDKNIPAAVQRIRLQQVPLAFQADQYVDILTRIVEERRGAVRRCDLAFIAGFAAAENESAFDRKECLTGIESFFRDVYAELCNEVHRLPAIMKSEFMPTMYNVFPAEELNKVVPSSMRR